MLLVCVFFFFFPLLSSIWVMKIMSSVFCLMLSSFSASCMWLFLYAELFPSPWNQALVCTCDSMWLYKSVLVDFWGFCYCLSPSLIYVHPMFPHTQKLLLCGHWPRILIFLSGSFPELIVMQFVPKLCPDFGRAFFHNAPHILEASLVLITPTVAGHFPYILSYTCRSTSLWNLSWIPLPCSSSPFPEAQAAAGPPLLGLLLWPPQSPSQATFPSALRLPVLHFYG